MQVAYYARVSTHQQQHEGTIESQRRSLQHYIQHHGWSLLPDHEYIDEGISGARLGTAQLWIAFVMRLAAASSTLW